MWRHETASIAIWHSSRQNHRQFFLLEADEML
jgi:hypothetical protein